MGKQLSHTISGFTVWYDGRSIVTITKADVAPEQFDEELNQAHGAMEHFQRNKPGSDWGCDGVGYMIQKRLGVVEIKRSGVGPKAAKAGFDSLKKA